MHTRTTVLAALPQPRHAASAVADVAASHAGLRSPVLPIECVRTYAPGISTGDVAVSRAFSTLAGAAGPRSRRARQLQTVGRSGSFASGIIADVHILSFGPRGRLPADAWLSGLTRAR